MHREQQRSLRWYLNYTHQRLEETRRKDLSFEQRMFQVQSHYHTLLSGLASVLPQQEAETLKQLLQFGLDVVFGKSKEETVSSGAFPTTKSDSPLQ